MKTIDQILESFDEKFFSPKTKWAQDKEGKWYDKNNVRDFLSSSLLKVQEETREEKKGETWRRAYMAGVEETRVDIKNRFHKIHMLDHYDKDNDGFWEKEYGNCHTRSMNIQEYEDFITFLSLLVDKQN